MLNGGFIFSGCLAPLNGWKNQPCSKFAFESSGVQDGLELRVEIDAAVGWSSVAEVALNEGFAAVGRCSTCVNHFDAGIDVLRLMLRQGWVLGIRNANFGFYL